MGDAGIADVFSLPFNEGCLLPVPFQERSPIMLRAYFRLSVLLLVLGLPSADIAQACPLCFTPGQSLSESVQENDIVLLAEFVEAIRKSPDSDPSGCVFRSLEVHKGEWKTPRIELPRYESGKPGDLFLMRGSIKKAKEADAPDSVEWASPQGISEIAFRYLQQAPSTETNGAVRLKYFLKFFDSTDDTIANDAHGEFAMAKYEDVVAVRDLFPRAKLREWMDDAKKPKTRRGLYGMMLGLCGNADDAEFLNSFFKPTPNDEFPLGLDGMLAGYVMLKGEAGLAHIEAVYSKDQKANPTDLGCVQKVLNFFWSYEPNRFPKDRLRASMRLLLDQPNWADQVIENLARWQDWSAQARVIAMFDDPKSQHARKAIVTYLRMSELAGAKLTPVPEHALVARKQLAVLRETAPELMESIERDERRPAKKADSKPQTRGRSTAALTGFAALVSVGLIYKVWTAGPASP